MADHRLLFNRHSRFPRRTHSPNRPARSNGNYRTTHRRCLRIPATISTNYGFLLIVHITCTFNGTVCRRTQARHIRTISHIALNQLGSCYGQTPRRFNILYDHVAAIACLRGDRPQFLNPSRTPRRSPARTRWLNLASSRSIVPRNVYFLPHRQHNFIRHPYLRSSIISVGHRCSGRRYRWAIRSSISTTFAANKLHKSCQRSFR